MKRLALAWIVLLPAGDAWSTPLQDFHAQIVRAESAILQGDEGGYRERATLLTRPPASLPVDWAQRRERQTAAVLVLSGFSPLLLASCLNEPACGGDDRAILQAARLHGAGKAAESAAAIAALGSRAGMPDALTGLLMLAEAQGVASTQRERALDRFAFARLAAPGTLIEEAALRASLALVDPRNEPARAALLTRQLLTRFSRSHYMNAFMPRIIAAASRLPDPHASALLDALPAPIAQTISLERARDAALTLDAERMRAEADRLRPQVLTVAAAARLALYDAAVQSVGPQQETGRRAAAALDASLLDTRDRDLMRAILQRTAQAAGGGPATHSGVSPAVPRAGDEAVRSRIAEAERLLRNTDKLLDAAP